MKGIHWFPVSLFLPFLYLKFPFTQSGILLYSPPPCECLFTNYTRRGIHFSVCFPISLPHRFIYSLQCTLLHFDFLCLFHNKTRREFSGFPALFFPSFSPFPLKHFYCSSRNILYLLSIPYLSQWASVVKLITPWQQNSRRHAPHCSLHVFIRTIFML